MPCYHPLKAYRNRAVDPVGKKIVFRQPRTSEAYDPITLPCGQCVGCRLERSRKWAVRLMHEAQMHERSSFITLTFSPEELVKRDNPMSVDVKDFQLFMKKLRHRVGKVRFFHCGEYGDKNGRPHYHACIFGWDFPDKTLWKISNGQRLYISDTLKELWPYGFSTIGDVTFESAAYVARYIMKKVNGDMAEERYYDRETGEVIKPEYITMSRRPGIGKTWLEKYGSDVYPHDEVIVNGVKCKPPRYYDEIYKQDRPYEFDDIKFNRLLSAEKNHENNTPERLSVREHCLQARIKKLERPLD